MIFKMIFYLDVFFSDKTSEKRLNDRIISRVHQSVQRCFRDSHFHF